jgi:hypothetical protein
MFVCLFVCPGPETHISKKVPGNIARSKSLATLPVPCVTSSSCPWQQKEKKTLPVPYVTSSSCPWQQKEKKNTARSLCNFLLLSLEAKGKFETGQG